jgi:hypothetical protein
MKLLDFRLPVFARHTWASERARDTWWPRMQEAAKRGADIACRLAMSGARPCVLRVVPAWQLFELYGKLPALGLALEILEARGEHRQASYFNPPGAGANNPIRYNVVIGRADNVADFKSAWEAGDEAALDGLSGYPACCRRFFKQACVAEARVDPVWQMASKSRGREAEPLVLEVEGPPHTNVLWRSLGLRVVNHWPCHFGCEATIELAEEFFDAGRRGGYEPQVGWLLEILSWPVEWSALHGIAEIKTPVLKATTNTDATAEKYTVRRLGASYPAEGAQGIGFPYARPRRLPVTDSEGFRRGLENPINVVRITSKNRPDKLAHASLKSIVRDAVDWKRMAEPQDDQYDTRVTLEFATSGGSPLRRESYVRRPANGSPTIFDGAVAVRHLSAACPRPSKHINGPVDHPNIALAAEYVRRWPTVFMQFRALMDSFHPMIDLDVPAEKFGVVLGSSSHSEEAMFGTMYATFHDPLGLAQAFVHEMAHQKLRALGISFETTTGLITNRADELFVSPIRKDRPRPMSAVFHAEYSFIYVTALDIKMIEAEDDARDKAALLTLLARNVARMEEGLRVIRQHIKVDADGRHFVSGFCDWAESIIARGNTLLKAT